MIHPSHTMRFSDSSLYDAVCAACGATDADGAASHPCIVAVGDAPSLPVVGAEPSRRHRFRHNMTPDQHLAEALKNEQKEQAYAASVTGQPQAVSAQNEIMKQWIDTKMYEFRSSWESPPLSQVVAMEQAQQQAQIGGDPNVAAVPPCDTESCEHLKQESEDARIARIWAAVESIAKGE